MEYRSLFEVYDRLDATSSTFERIESLAEALGGRRELSTSLTLPPRGRLFAPWEADEFGVSSSRTTDTITTTTGVDRERVESWWHETAAKLEPLIEPVDGRTMPLGPEVVGEAKYEEVRESSAHDSGYTLRFPRFGGFRDDFDPKDADTFERVRRRYEDQ